MNKPEATIITGDAEAQLALLPEASHRIAITSPPYNLLNSTGGGTRSGGPLQRHPGLQNGYDRHKDDLPHADYVAWQRRIIELTLRALTHDGALFYNHKWRVQGGLLQDRSDITEGFPVRQIIIWDRTSGINFTERFYRPQYEVIYLIAKPDFKITREASRLGDVWRIPPASRNPHPAPFPVELASRCCAAITHGRVLDPFCGSGSTLLAAQRAGLPSTGIDLSPDYCALARKRLLEDHQPQLTT